MTTLCYTCDKNSTHQLEDGGYSCDEHYFECRVCRKEYMICNEDVVGLGICYGCAEITDREAELNIRQKDVKVIIDYLKTFDKIYIQLLTGGPPVPQGNLQKFLEENDEQFKRWWENYKFLRRSNGLEPWPVIKK